MPGAALVATQLTDHSARPFVLTLGNMDVLRYVDYESIEIVEDAPGAVSQCSFTIRDPAGVVGTPPPGSEVWMWDTNTNTPLFGGYISEWTATPYAGGTGRSIAVTALGLEVLLDWAVMPTSAELGSDILPTDLTTKIKFLADQFPTFGFRTIVGTTDNGDADHPIGITRIAGAYPGQLYAGTIVGPGSLREAVGQLLQFAHIDTTPPPTDPRYYDAVLTVDFLRGFRVYLRNQKPDDYTDLTINDSLGSALASTTLNYEVHPGDVVRAVYINGASPAGSGFVTDGTGIIGRQAYLDVPGSTNVIEQTFAGNAYLAASSSLVRGTVTIADYTPSVGTVHPGSNVVISDGNVSLAAQSYVISTITKTFNHSGSQNWTVAFGGRRPSAMSNIRRDFPSTGEGQVLGTFTDAIAGIGSH